MSGNGENGGIREVTQTVDPVREIDEVIKLIHFLGRAKPGGFTAALGWAEEKLHAVREAVAEHGSVCEAFGPERPLHGGHAESFPLLSSVAAIYGRGNGS